VIQLSNIIIESLKKLSNNSEANVGTLGGIYEAGTGAVTPATGYVFNKIEVITEAQITLVGNITGITAVTFPVGTVIQGKYTSLTVASGTVMAYYGYV